MCGAATAAGTRANPTTCSLHPEPSRPRSGSRSPEGSATCSPEPRNSSRQETPGWPATSWRWRHSHGPTTPTCGQCAPLPTERTPTSTPRRWPATFSVTPHRPASSRGATSRATTDPAAHRAPQAPCPGAGLGSARRPGYRPATVSATDVAHAARQRRTVVLARDTDDLPIVVTVPAREGGHEPRVEQFGVECADPHVVLERAQAPCLGICLEGVETRIGARLADHHGEDLVRMGLLTRHHRQFGHRRPDLLAEVEARARAARRHVDHGAFGLVTVVGARRGDECHDEQQRQGRSKAEADHGGGSVAEARGPSSSTPIG